MAPATLASRAHAPTHLLAASGGEGNVAAVRRFLEALELGANAEALAAFFTSDAVAVEYPNYLTPATAVRDIAAMRSAFERGRDVCPRQHYEVHSAVAVGNLVAIEATWSATVAVPLGALPAGGTMRAHFAAFYEMRDGRIARVRNYDCFDAFQQANAGR